MYKGPSGTLFRITMHIISFTHYTEKLYNHIHNLKSYKLKNNRNLVHHRKAFTHTNKLWSYTQLKMLLYDIVIWKRILLKTQWLPTMSSHYFVNCNFETALETQMCNNDISTGNTRQLQYNNIQGYSSLMWYFPMCTFIQFATKIEVLYKVSNIVCELVLFQIYIYMYMHVNSELSPWWPLTYLSVMCYFMQIYVWHLQMSRQMWKN